MKPSKICDIRRITLRRCSSEIHITQVTICDHVSKISNITMN